LIQDGVIPWKLIAGFRDVLIHDYMSIDLDEVWQTIERDLPTLKRAVQAMLEALGDDDKQA
jgi:uncharacterized protein with HEPN domain